MHSYFTKYNNIVFKMTTNGKVTIMVVKKKNDIINNL